MDFTFAAEGQAHTQTHAHTHALGRKQALFSLMDDRNRGRRLALKTSRGCGVMKMSDRNQHAIYFNMFNQIAMCVCVRLCLHKCACGWNKNCVCLLQVYCMTEFEDKGQIQACAHVVWKLFCSIRVIFVSKVKL